MLLLASALASPEQLSRFAAAIVQLPLNLSSHHEQGRAGQLLPEHLLLRTLRSAQFWELGKLRMALIDYVLAATKAMEARSSDISPSKATKKKSKSSSHSTSPEATVTRIFELLLFFPVEYFTKTCRADLVKRVLAADRQLYPCDTEDKAHALALLRYFLDRTFRFTGNIEQQSVF
jgi:hypothetical protein